MKRLKSICLTVLIYLISNCVYSQTDSLINNKIKLLNIYSGFGVGICNSGAGVAVDGTFILSNNWGVSIRYNPNYLSARNLPDDYVDLVLFMPFLTNGLPTDDINVLSVNTIKEFPTQSKLIRFGIEFGPALVISQIAVFTPVSNWIPLLGSNYTMTHDNNTTIGLSLRGKAEFPLTRFAGLEVAAHTNINKFRSILGVEFCLNLGLIRKR